MLGATGESRGLIIWKREEEEARSAYFEFGLPGYPDTRWKVGEVRPSQSVRCYWEPKGGGTILFTRLVTTWLSRNDRVSSSSTTTEYRWGGLLGSPAETFGHKFRGPSEKCSGGR